MYAACHLIYDNLLAVQTTFRVHHAFQYLKVRATRGTRLFLPIAIALPVVVAKFLDRQFFLQIVGYALPTVPDFCQVRIHPSLFLLVLEK